MVAFLYSDTSKFYMSKCKIFFINFLDELGNFKQKKFYSCKATQPISM